MLIGGDDTSNDVITLGTCIVFVFVFVFIYLPYYYNNYKEMPKKKCRKKWRGGLKETIELMLIRPPQLQFVGRLGFN